MIVFISAYSPDVAGLGPIALGFLDKPFSDEALVATVGIAEAIRAGESPDLAAIPEELHIYP
jgi:hypothetical protein